MKTNGKQKASPQDENNVIKRTYGEFDKLFAVLAKDFCQTRDAMKEKDSPTARRTFVRALFALIEGMTFNMKYETLHVGRLHGMEFSGEVLDKLRGYRAIEGNVGRRVKKYIHLSPDQNLKFALDWFFAAFAPNALSKLTVSVEEWQEFRKCIKIRNRVTHPRFASDLHVSDVEIRDLFKVAGWFMELYGVVNMLCGTSLMEKAESIKKAWRERYQPSKAN